MSVPFNKATQISGILFLLCAIGCLKSDSAPETPPSAAANQTDTAGHQHPLRGPHDGDLIELGDESWHAELVHSENTVTVYLLDSTATDLAAIDAPELTINLMHLGKPKQYVLPAVPQAGDPVGTSTRFELKSEGLVHALEHDDHDARLSVLIGGTQYRGQIQHAHDHADGEDGHSH